MRGLRLRQLCILCICIVAVASRSLDSKTTCYAPPAYVGEPGSLTCRFRVNVTSAKLSFSVRHAALGDFDYNRDTVLDCDWIDGKQVCTTIKKGFTYDNHVSNLLTLIIPNVTLEHRGLYSCQLFQEGPGDVQICSLNVSEREKPMSQPDSAVQRDAHQTRSTGETQGNKTQDQTRELNLVPIIIPAVLSPVVVAVAVIAVVCMCKKRKRPVKKYQDGDTVGEIKDLIEARKSPLRKVPDKEKRKSCKWNFKNNIRL